MLLRHSDFVLENLTGEKTAASPLQVGGGIGAALGGIGGGYSGGEGFDPKKALIGAALGGAGGAAAGHGLATAQMVQQAQQAAQQSRKARGAAGAGILGLGALASLIGAGRAVRKGTETGKKIQGAAERVGQVTGGIADDIGAGLGVVQQASGNLPKRLDQAGKTVEGYTNQAQKVRSAAENLSDKVLQFRSATGT